jgi:UDP-N-acetyl-D-mannosaminuronate dehydrogenase
MYTVRKVLKNLPKQGSKRVTILGLSFKEDIDDL